LKKKGVKFEWTSKCEQMSQQLKEILTGKPISKILDPNKYFVVCTNACKEGIDRVLSQRDHVVCYESRKLKDHEINYATHDLELVVIVYALKMWRNYFMGNKFELRIDQCGLNHLFGQSTLNSRQTRWMEFLSEYDFETNHIKGK
jgi:hypothetical protein